MTTEYAPIRARVSEDTLNKVSRFFNATLSDILYELLQNARRAKATEIRIDTDFSGTDWRYPTISITDNGRGIKDPQVLLSLGESDWSSHLEQSEDPAGMGIFSLSNRPLLKSAPVTGV